jgi:FlaA1/EpsC-like NDP-sugar epimerase
VQQARLSEDGTLLPGVELSPLRIQSNSSVSALSSASVRRKTVQLGSLDPPVLAVLRHWSKPLMLVVALVIALLFTSQPITPACGALALATVLFARQIFSPLRLASDGVRESARYRIVRLTLECGAVYAVLLCLGVALRLDHLFPHNLIISWFTLMPLTLVIGDRWSSRALARAPSAHNRHIIIGVNQVGVELARRISRTLG